MADGDARQGPAEPQPRSAPEPTRGSAGTGSRLLSSVVSDLLGISARRLLKAIADGESNPAALARVADPSLRATPEQLCDVLSACQELHPVYRELVKMAHAGTGNRQPAGSTR
jgi:hypothetical protein